MAKNKMAKHLMLTSDVGTRQGAMFIQLRSSLRGRHVGNEMLCVAKNKYLKHQSCKKHNQNDAKMTKVISTINFRETYNYKSNHNLPTRARGTSGSSSTVSQ